MVSKREIAKICGSCNFKVERKGYGLRVKSRKAETGERPYERKRANGLSVLPLFAYCAWSGGMGGGRMLQHRASLQRRPWASREAQARRQEVSETTRLAENPTGCRSCHRDTSEGHSVQERPQLSSQLQTNLAEEFNFFMQLKKKKYFPY